MSAYGPHSNGGDFALLYTQAQMDAMIAVERERCAAIAEEAAKPTRKPHQATEWPCNCETASDIAARIRSGK